MFRCTHHAWLDAWTCSWSGAISVFTIYLREAYVEQQRVTPHARRQMPAVWYDFGYGCKHVCMTHSKLPVHLVKPFTLVTGLDSQQKQLTFIAGSTPEARRQVRVPLAALQDGRLSLRTDLMDAHLYIFHKRTFFKAFEARPAYGSIRQVI